MCGIVGVFTRTPTDPDELQARATRMADAIRHRGPDDSGVFVNADFGVGFGFRRLSIVDLSVLGHQPMTSATERFVLMMNGEIYNFEELRADLIGRGCRFRGRSDTEVALAAFETWGIEDSLRRFNGMFAIALWDQEKKELTLARDRVGKKPLYIHQNGKTILFGSELKGLVADHAFNRTVDRSAVEAYLRHMYVPAPDCIYANTQKLSPGHFLTIAAGSQPLPQSRSYWSLRDRAALLRKDALEQKDSATADALIHDLLRDAVRLRMQADVPLGALLSGGIDSSLVVAIMSEMASDPVLTFTIGFDVPEYDEADHARAVANHLGTRHTELYVDGNAALALVPRLPEIFDEPLSDPSQIPTYLVCELARRHVTVALTGDGGDELFAGYHRYLQGSRMIASLARRPFAVRNAVGSLLDAIPEGIWAATERVGGGRAPRLMSGKVRKAAQLMHQNQPRDMYRSLLSVWQDPAAFLNSPKKNGSAAWAAGWNNSDLLRSMMLVDQIEYLPDDLLAKLDRASMAVSLEARAPLLDFRVIEASWRLSHELLIDGPAGKQVLRRLLDNYIPRGLIDRPKMGFSVPVAQWLRGPLRTMAGDMLSPDSIKRFGIMDPGPVTAAWKRFESGDTRDALGLWTLVMFQAWCLRWLDTGGVSSDI